MSDLTAIFKPALLVIDFQEDFCPPHGSLAVPDGRTILPILNALLLLPFALKIATRDFHPKNHVSFASNHLGASPYTSNFSITHPTNPSLSYTTTLWPDHCVQNTTGSSLIPELDVSRVDRIIEKGKNPDVEMYSAFYDPFHISDSGLKDVLKGAGITDVFVVGLAADYCVKASAEHAVDEGFRTYIVEEATKPVSPEEWPEVKRGIREHGVKFISLGGRELGRVQDLVI